MADYCLISLLAIILCIMRTLPNITLTLVLDLKDGLYRDSVRLVQAIIHKLYIYASLRVPAIYNPINNAM